MGLVRTVCSHFINSFRFFILKILHPSSSISIGRFLLIERGCGIEIDKKSTLTLKSNLHMKKNAALSIRKGAILDVGTGVFINRNTLIVAHKRIVIGNGVTIGPNVCIFDHDHDLNRRGSFIKDDIIIGNNVWIGANSIILKGSFIGDNSVIAAGSIVHGSIPADTVLIQKRTNTFKSLNNAL